MTDCLITLHAIMRDPAEMARAREEIQAAWVNAARRLEKPPRERLTVTGLAAARVRCPTAKRVILTTEKNWSQS